MSRQIAYNCTMKYDPKPKEDEHGETVNQLKYMYICMYDPLVQ